MFKISIVIPTLNEAAGIRTRLEALQSVRAEGHEVIVVDGESDDDTVAIATTLCDRLVVAERGRARQLNAGAQSASGNLLLFLHADTQAPPGLSAILHAVLRRDAAQWGRFDVRLDASERAYRVIETLMNWRSRVTGIATGDQAIFVTRDLFNEIGGFPEIALMEDIALSKRLRRYGWPVCLRQRVTTSARRWQQHGVCTTVAKMWCLRLAYFCGVSPDRLHLVYDGDASSH